MIVQPFGTPYFSPAARLLKINRTVPAHRSTHRSSTFVYSNVEDIMCSHSFWNL